MNEQRDQPELLTHSCAECGSRWFGLLRSHATCCHQTFDDLALFDLHRETGECMWPGRLGSLVKNKGGVWIERVQVMPGRRHAS